MTTQKNSVKVASNTSEAQGKPKRTDWEAIERDYRADVRSIRELAKDYGVSDTAVRKKAKAEGWVRGSEARTSANHEALVKVQNDALAVLNPMQARFASEYLIDLNATQAAIRAGYAPNSANEQGARLLAHASIRKAIDIGMANRLVRVEIDQDAIVRELLNVVRADANELIEYRRTCCRYCWGKGFKFQRTASEMENDRAEHELAEQKNLMASKDQRRAPKAFDEAGGIGYDKRKDPHENCAECFGQGVGSTFIKDTRNLSLAARALYAGVKQTKDGIEIKMHDKQGFMQLLMRHAGMLNDKLKLQGDSENPLTLLLQQVNGTGLPVVKDDDAA